jgi:outer membrane autotransporter protein
MTGQDYNQIHLSGSVVATANNGEAYSIVMGCENEAEVSLLENGYASNTLYVMNGASLTGDVLNAGDSTAYAILGAEKDAETFMATEGVDSSFEFAFANDFLGNDTLNPSPAWDVTLLGGTLEGDNVFIDGNYTQDAGATYRALLGYEDEVELDVTGVADLAEGSFVEIATNGYVADGAIRTLVSAPGGLTPADDTAKAALLTEDSLVLDYTLVPETTNTLEVQVSRTPYAALPISGNAAVIGNALIAAASESDAANAYVGMVDGCSTADCLGQGLGALSPEAYANLLDIGLAGSNLYRSSVSARLGGLHLTNTTGATQYASNTLTNDGPALSRVPAFERTGQGWSGWVRILGATGDQDEDGGIQGYEFDTAGISFGFDNKLNDNFVLGIGLGYAESDVDFDLTQNTDVDSYHLALYGTYSTPQYYVDGAVLYADSEYDSDRDIPLLGETATSDTDGCEWGLYVGAGYKMVQDADWYFTPTASIEWAQADIDGFTEKGSSLNLTVDDYDADSLVTTLGFRLGANLAVGATKIVPEFRLAWAHEFGDTDRDVKAGFLGTTSTFTIDGVEPDEDSALVGIGLNAAMTDNLTLFLDYDGEFRSDFDGHAVSGGLRYNF